MTLLRTSTLMGATLTMGLVAGAFALYAHTIMPGLRKTDDRTFVAAFQQIDRAIINPWFMITAFGGALVLTLVRRHRQPRHAGAATGSPPRSACTWSPSSSRWRSTCRSTTRSRPRATRPHIDVAQVRAQFNEARWAAWNLVRVATSVPAFGLLAWALVLCGRANP